MKEWVLSPKIRDRTRMSALIILHVTLYWRFQPGQSGSKILKRHPDRKGGSKKKKKRKLLNECGCQGGWKPLNGGDTGGLGVCFLIGVHSQWTRSLTDQEELLQLALMENERATQSHNTATSDRAGTQGKIRKKNKRATDRAEVQGKSSCLDAAVSQRTTAVGTGKGSREDRRLCLESIVSGFKNSGVRWGPGWSLMPEEEMNEG